MAEVVIYTRDFCYYSDAARELLTRKGVAFKEINATGQRELRAKMIEKANGASTFPQVFIGDTHVGGCDELYALDRTGKLKAMLEQPALEQPAS
jgi:glutaredoxin 3